jgi:thiosulfate/3-mercaptopyruvate sulfurtransferase
MRWIRSDIFRGLLLGILIVAAAFTAGAARLLFGAERRPTGHAKAARSRVAVASTPPPQPASSLRSKSEADKAADSQSDPWTNAQTVQPAQLAKELGDSRLADKPTVICVAPHVLYEGGHISGALFHGAGSTQPGIDDLKKWAQSVSRSANIVIYCGCCPLEHCPNLRPAFVALRDMGFTHLRALLIKTNFYTDWVKPGYPTEKTLAQ